MQPDLVQLLRLAQSPEGQKLLKHLQQKGPEALRTAAVQFSAGEADEAARTLGPMLSDPETQKLLSALGEML